MAACASRKSKREEDSTDDAPDAKRMRAQPSPLLDLPDDLLGRVAGFLTEPADLDRFARLQRSFYYAVAVHGPLVPLDPLRISKLSRFSGITKATMRHVREIEFSRMHNPRHKGLRDWDGTNRSHRNVARNHMSMMIRNLRSLSIDGEPPFSTLAMCNEILPMAKKLERVRLSLSVDTDADSIEEESYRVAKLQNVIDALMELVTHHKLHSVHIGSAFKTMILDTVGSSWIGLLLNRNLINLSFSGMRLLMENTFILPPTIDQSMRHFTLSNVIIREWSTLLGYLGAQSKLETLHIDTTQLIGNGGNFFAQFLMVRTRTRDNHPSHLRKLVLDRVTMDHAYYHRGRMHYRMTVYPDIARLDTLCHLSLNRLCVTDATLQAICANMHCLIHLGLDRAKNPHGAPTGAPFCTSTLHNLLEGVPALETLSLKNVRKAHDHAWPNYNPDRKLPMYFLRMLVSKPNMKSLCLAGSDLLQPGDLCGYLLDLETLDVTDADLATSDQIVAAIKAITTIGGRLRILHIGGMLGDLHARCLLEMRCPEKSIKIVGLDAASKMLSHGIREKLAKMYS
jgi:hypothetical protein